MSTTYIPEDIYRCPPYIQVSSTGGAASTAFMKCFEGLVYMNPHTFPFGSWAGVQKHQRIPGTNSTCIIGDYFRVSKEVIRDSSIDLIIDTCAVTHFAPSHIHAANDGCYYFGNDAMRILKPGGYFICVSDIDETSDRGEFLAPENMIESFTGGGLSLVGSPSFHYDDAFQGALKVARLVFQKPLGEK
tara:strand:+ start:6552 stop:7115 length:564 start_codon:yes stop_codon:yes gene_type:complete